jgi:hypothetical protein
MVAYAFTRIALSSVRKEPCKGGILVEEGILRKAQSPSGATFSYQPPTTKDVEPFAVIIPEIAVHLISPWSNDKVLSALYWKYGMNRDL